MSTCVRCGRKGKRSCPALAGSICPSCCGKHRVQDIVCPPDCVHLGGLSVVRDPERAAAGFTSADYEAMFSKLADYARGAVELGRAALRRFYGDDAEPYDWETPIAMAYLYYGHRDASGRRMIDRFLAARGRSLASAEVAAVLALQRAWASLFEITAVQKGVGLVLRDLLSGETRAVREVSATAQLAPRDVLFAWLIEHPDHLELTGAACIVPPRHLAGVRAALDAELARARRERPGIADRELVGELAWAVPGALRSALRAFRMPELRTTSGELLVMCEARYAVSDEEAVRAGLAGLAEIEAAREGRYTWLDRGDNDVLGPGPLTLGNLRLEGHELVLETMSRERHERGRRMLEDALGEHLRHRADSFRDPEAVIREARARPADARDEIPEEIRREILGEYFRDYYRRWLDLPLPVLGGMTPRVAATAPEMRAEVEALLAELERGVARLEGGDAVDVAAMRRELGLLDEDAPGEELHYDAAVAPDAERWLELDDGIKARAVEAHHRELLERAAHPELPGPIVHAMMHVIVENQLAGGEPLEARATLERLVAAGLTRHAAIHAIGSVVASALWKVAREEAPFNRRANARQLGRLRPEGWSF